MNTYQLLDIGVQVVETGEVILPTDANWHFYKEDLAAGSQTLPHLPPAPPDISVVRAELSARVNLERDTRISSGVTFAGTVFDSTQASRDELGGVMNFINAGLPLPVGFAWRAKDNTDHPFDTDALKGLTAAMISKGYGCHLNARALKAAIDASADPGSIDITVGWPT